MANEELSYERVLEYLAEREGETVTVSSYPTFREAGTPSMLGLQVTTSIGTVEAVAPHEEQAWLNGQAGARIRFVGEDVAYGDGLVLTREWFAAAELSSDHAYLIIVVRATPDAPPLYPPLGQERPDDETRDVPTHELVGWGFAFDFDGSAPLSGRWAIERERAGEED